MVLQANIIDGKTICLAKLAWRGMMIAPARPLWNQESTEKETNEFCIPLKNRVLQSVLTAHLPEANHP